MLLLKKAYTQLEHPQLLARLKCNVHTLWTLRQRQLGSATLQSTPSTHSGVEPLKPACLPLPGQPAVYDQ